MSVGFKGLKKLSSYALLLIYYVTVFSSELLEEAASLCTSETSACTKCIRQDSTEVGSRWHHQGDKDEYQWAVGGGA